MNEQTAMDSAAAHGAPPTARASACRFDFNQEGEIVDDWVAEIRPPMPPDHILPMPRLVVGPFRGTKEEAAEHFGAAGYPAGWTTLYLTHDLMPLTRPWPWQWRTDLHGDLLVRTALKLRHAYLHLWNLRMSVPPPSPAEWEGLTASHGDTLLEAERTLTGRYHQLHDRLMNIGTSAEYAVKLSDVTLYRWPERKPCR